MTDPGVASVYRGYRLQTLYALSRLLASIEQLIYRPEGIEDLDIYSSDGRLVESIQVKARTANLTLSDFSPGSSHSFFSRAINTLTNHPRAKVSIVTYGAVGSEMDNAWSSEGTDRESVTKKLLHSGYTTDEVDTILATDIVRADESNLDAKIGVFLTNTVTGIDPSFAFDHLMYWIYLASESGGQITLDIVRNRLVSVGQFLSDRHSYHEEWFTSITPIEEEDLTSSEVERLTSEYYQGVDARYQHILAGLDISRPKILEKISEMLQSTNVVILHGASGQGKSTIAYRYLHDFVPSGWKFGVTVSRETTQVLRIANALSGHAKAVGSPIVVAIDVLPGNGQWVELVRKLSALESIQIIVTIREEDLRRTQGLRVRFDYEDIEMVFDKPEGRDLFTHLQRHSGRFLTFEESWESFGGQGPLLEYVYLLTQSESLTGRIHDQIGSLQDQVREGSLAENEMLMLRLVAVASTYHAKLAVQELTTHLSLPEPTRTIELFTKEYLITVGDNGRTIDGLHAIRSSIMSDCLFSYALEDWIDYALECLPLIVDEDLEIFLLHAFSRKSVYSVRLIQVSMTMPGVGWSSLAGILRAVLWNGIREYVESNRKLIDELYIDSSTGWSMILDPDIADIGDSSLKNWWEGLSFVTDERKKFIANARSRQTSADSVFDDASRLLARSFEISDVPNSELEYVGYAEILYWSSRLCSSEVVDYIVQMCDLENACAHLDIVYLADVVYALHFALKDGLEQVYGPYREKITERFMLETNTVLVDDDGSLVFAHFVPSSVVLTATQVDETDQQVLEWSLHRDTMYCINLLRKLWPDREKYGGQGYGHRMGMISPDYDETYKSGISAQSIPPEWAVKINGIFIQLANYSNRPDTWAQYSTDIQEVRLLTVDFMKLLIDGLDAYFRKQNRKSVAGSLVSDTKWVHCQQSVEQSYLLPKCAVDEWGFAGESSRESIDNTSSNQPTYRASTVVVKQNKELVDAVNEFTRSLRNFIDQSAHVLATNCMISGLEEHLRESGKAILAEKGIKTDYERLATVNLISVWDSILPLQEHFIKRFLSYFPEQQIDTLHTNESRYAKLLTCMWFQFAYHPGRKTSNASTEIPREVSESHSRLRRQIGKELRLLSNTSYSARTIRNRLNHNGTELFTIAVDVVDPYSYYAAIESVVIALQKVLRTETYSSTRDFVIRHIMEDIAIVPLLHGKAIKAEAIIIPKLGYQDSEVLSKWFYFVPKSIDDENWQSLKLSLWELDGVQPAVDLEQHMAALSLYALQVGDLSRLSKDIEVEDNHPLVDLISNLSSRLSEQLQSVYDLMEVIVAKYNACDSERHEQRPYQDDAIGLLVQMNEQVESIGETAGGSSFTLDQIENWAIHLESTRMDASLFKFLWIADAINATENSMGK